MGQKRWPFLICMIQDTVQLVVLRGFFSIFTGDSSDLGTISTSKYFMNVQNVYQQKHIISAYHQINMARKSNANLNSGWKYHTQTDWFGPKSIPKHTDPWLLTWFDLMYSQTYPWNVQNLWTGYDLKFCLLKGTFPMVYWLQIKHYVIFGFGFYLWDNVKV